LEFRTHNFDRYSLERTSARGSSGQFTHNRIGWTAFRFLTPGSSSSEVQEFYFFGLGAAEVLQYIGDCNYALLKS
jgi:hypothetical protein